jgi:hypothetical protein
VLVYSKNLADASSFKRNPTTSVPNWSVVGKASSISLPETIVV